MKRWMGPGGSSPSTPKAIHASAVATASSCKPRAARNSTLAVCFAK
jgi:hypothetical protein